VEARVEAAEQAERSAAGGYWPTVTLSAGYGSGYSSAASDVSFADQLDERQSGSVSLGLSYPLFDRFATGRTRERARVTVSNARLELADLRQTVALEVKRAVLDRDTARERLRAAVAQVAAAERALEAVQHRYEAGGSTLHEVTLARSDLVGANSARVSAHYRLLWQRHVLDYYVGDLDPEADLIP
jgi:outer membrane protein